MVALRVCGVVCFVRQQRSSDCELRCHPVCSYCPPSLPFNNRKPDLYFTPNAFNSAVLDRCPTMQSTYQCTPFLTNGHAETILVAKLRKAPGVVYKREILLTKDGGAVTVDWEHVDDDGKVCCSCRGDNGTGGRKRQFGGGGGCLPGKGWFVVGSCVRV